MPVTSSRWIDHRDEDIGFDNGSEKKYGLAVQ
jgi:hypothetical protein